MVPSVSAGAAALSSLVTTPAALSLPAMTVNLLSQGNLMLLLLAWAFIGPGKIQSALQVSMIQLMVRHPLAA